MLNNASTGGLTQTFSSLLVSGLRTFLLIISHQLCLVSTLGYTARHRPIQPFDDSGGAAKFGLYPKAYIPIYVQAYARGKGRAQTASSFFIRMHI